MNRPQARAKLSEFLVGSIEQARAVEKPFYHLQFDRVFPQDVYDAMIREMPVDRDYHALPGRNNVNILDDGSASLAFLLRRRPTGLRVGELMTSPAVTTTLSTSLAEAARCMRDNRIHRVVAIDEEGRPVGVLAASDFVALYADG